MKINSELFISKVLEVKAELESTIDFTGKREKTVEDKKNELFVEAVFEAVLRLTEEGEKVVTPLGTSEVVETAERNGRNPSTKKEMVIPAGKKLKMGSNSETKKRFK